MIAEHSAAERAISTTLMEILHRLGGAIEYWTVTCMSRRQLGDPGPFVAKQWGELHDEVQALRIELNQRYPDGVVPPIVDEQLIRLMSSVNDLREVFDLLAVFDDHSSEQLERALVRLGSLWNDLRRRITLLGVIIPLPAPLPGLTGDQEAYYQASLDQLFDRFEAARYRPTTLR